MKKMWMTLAGLWFLLAGLQAQEKAKVGTPRFQDGLYQSFESFRANRPDYRWKDLRGDWFFNAESGTVTVASLLDTEGNSLPVDAYWGLCLDGRPAIRIPTDSSSRSSAVFARLSPLGAVSYFSYEAVVRDTVEMAAYNPHNGLPFRKGKVARSEHQQRERILLSRSGEVLPFTLENLAAWTASDGEIRRALGLLKQPDRDKMLRAMEVFNQRNPF